MLKTGITSFTAEELAQLENYVYTWKLNGASAWCSPFTKHPDGFGKPMDDTAAETLRTLNALRERVTAPLIKFSERTAHASGEQISEAVYKLLIDFDLEQSFPIFCRTLENAGRDDLSAAQMRIWDLLMEVLDQMAGVLGEQIITGEKYGRLLKEIVSGEDVSDIPQSMDSITFGTADRIRQSGAARRVPARRRARRVSAHSVRKRCVQRAGAPHAPCARAARLRCARRPHVTGKIPRLRRAVRRFGEAVSYVSRQCRAGGKIAR